MERGRRRDGFSVFFLLSPGRWWCWVLVFWPFIAKIICDRGKGIVVHLRWNVFQGNLDIPGGGEQSNCARGPWAGRRVGNANGCMTKTQKARGRDLGRFTKQQRGGRR